MEKIEKKGILVRVQDFLDSAKGRTLLNYAYSWGAAIVILGALFKLTHMVGANLMLFIGMGTEVLVFIISGFERPFTPERCEDEDESFVVGGESSEVCSVRKQVLEPVSATDSPASAGVSENERVLKSFAGGKALDVPAVETVTQEYVDQVRELTEKLLRVTQQSELMERNTEEIDNLGRNLISLNTFYQMHLRSVSSQMDNIDQVNVQTKKMLEQIEELNKVYARMVEAMKVNVPNGSTGNKA